MPPKPHKNEPSAADPVEPIGGAFVPDLGRPLPFGGGLPAFAVRDLKTAAGDLMAVQAQRQAPPRAQALEALTGAAIPGLLTPLAHGPARGKEGGAWFLVCRTPAGAALGTGTSVARRWPEAELLSCVLRPMAAVLADLQGRRVTHRAIRPDNVFQAAAGQPVVLGPAWAAPPASLQPAAFEPPYAICCLPGGRGEGSIADDVYALGVLLISLAAGSVPLAGLPDADVPRLKLERGSAAALSARMGLPIAIAELVAGMLAEDPGHRPSPAQLADPDLARGRRVAARPTRRAQRAFEIVGRSAWDARSLARGLAEAPDQAVKLLRGGAVERWLRRTLVDPTLAGQVEEAGRLPAVAPPEEAQADLLHVTRVIALLDPLAPPCWAGLSLWPDGLGPVLAAAPPAAQEVLRQMIEAEAIVAWASCNPDRHDLATLRVQARQHRSLVQKRGWGGGMSVLRYVLNPLAPCNSPALGDFYVLTARDLLHALEAEAARTESRPSLPMDAEAAAFLAAREPARMDRDLLAMAAPGEGVAALAQLRVLARLQQRLQPGPLPLLAAWLLVELRPALESWRGRTRRAAVETMLRERAASGQLTGLIDILDDAASRTQDEREAAAAHAAVAAIDATLGHLSETQAEAAERAARVGHEIATALAVIAVSAAAVALALG